MYNHINFFDLNKLGQNKNQLEKTNIEIVTPIEALSKGNMDKNLYNQFENYQPALLNKNNPNDMLKAYNFMLIDLQLYLDVHPEDENVKEIELLVISQGGKLIKMNPRIFSSQTLYGNNVIIYRTEDKYFYL